MSRQAARQVRLHLSEVEARTLHAGLLNAISGAVPLRPEQIPVGALQELIGAMIKTTEELFGYSEAWESRKGLPLGEARDLGEQ